MRIIKEAEERKNEILNVAEELFNQKGFDNTSTNNILEKTGIARGTLYYHFKSKEDIMDALIKRQNSRILNSIQNIVADKSVPIMERLVRMIMALNVSNENAEIINSIHKPQNALMNQKMQRTIISSFTPIFTELINEGIEQKIFTTPFPYESMEMVLVYAITIFDGNLIEITDSDRISRIEAFVFNVERLFGAKEGSFMNLHNVLGDGKAHTNGFRNGDAQCT